MTYASRSQHLKLARQIGELSQQRFEGSSDSDLSDKEDAYQDEESGYVQQRATAHTRGSSHSSSLPQSNGVGGGSSKFSRYMEAVKRGKFIGKVAGRGGHAHSSIGTDEREYVSYV